MSESTKQGLKLKRFIKATATDCSASILNSEVTFHYQQPPSEHLWAGLYAFFCSDHLSCQMEWTALKCCWAQSCWRAQFSVFFILSYVTLILNEVFFWKRKFHLSYKSISTESKGSCGWQMLVRIKTYLLTVMLALLPYLEYHFNPAVYFCIHLCLQSVCFELFMECTKDHL